MASGKPQLLFFAEMPGRGEMIRLLYHYAAADFEDKKIKFSQYPPLKRNPNEVPLGYLPVLTTPCGKKISQTTSIIRYVATELNLYGKDNVERAIIDSTIVSNKEIADKAVEIMFKVKGEKAKESNRKIIASKIDQYFPYFERLIKQNGGDFINGKEICVADIYLFDTMNLINQVIPDNTYFEKYPLLKNVCEKVAQSPNIKKYLASRKHPCQ